MSNRVFTSKEIMEIWDRLRAKECCDEATVGEFFDEILKDQPASSTPASKAEAVKEARNAALEEAAKHCEKTSGFSGSEHAARIRALKTLVILLPLLFVFGSVCAGEDAKGQSDAPKAKDAPRVAGNVGNRAVLAEYQRLRFIWQYHRAKLTQEERDQLLVDYARARAEWLSAQR